MQVIRILPKSDALKQGVKSPTFNTCIELPRAYICQTRIIK